MNEVVDLLNEILDELRTMNEKLDEIKVIIVSISQKTIKW